MYSNIFFKTIDISDVDSDLVRKDDAEIKLYKIELLEYDALISDLINILSPLERDRANRYHFIKDKNRFVICRALLKLLLAKHIGIDIDEIKLDIDANKKPYLLSHLSVFFNVSHSNDLALIAIAKSPIGVDIEYINKSFDYQEILPNIFHKIEIDEVNQKVDKHQTFYEFWTRKEAVVKAIGKGIDDDLVKLQVTDGLHSVPSELLAGYKKISVFSFNVNDDHVGALAFTEDIINLDKILFYSAPTPNDLKFKIIKL